MSVQRPDWWRYPERCANGHEWGPGPAAQRARDFVDRHRDPAARRRPRRQRPAQLRGQRPHDRPRRRRCLHRLLRQQTRRTAPRTRL